MHARYFSLVHPRWGETEDLVAERLVLACIGGSEHEIGGDQGFGKGGEDGAFQRSEDLGIGSAYQGRWGMAKNADLDGSVGECTLHPCNRLLLLLAGQKADIHLGFCFQGNDVAFVTGTDDGGNHGRAYQGIEGGVLGEEGEEHLFEECWIEKEQAVAERPLFSQALEHRAHRFGQEGTHLVSLQAGKSLGKRPQSGRK
ncbi:hypothetical protein SDC9_136798 [bioreactor metagenome]|uniref:Uncharacterized protein n=1 Tax=bioreactor metagenome TaxID=1076179 RepID=A0A645DK58_9ZZZZ